MRRPFAAVAVLGTAAAVFSLAGCGSSTSPSPTSFKSLSAADQQVLEQSAAQIVEGDIESFASLNPLTGFGFQRVAEKRVAAGYALAGRAGPRYQTTNCPNEEGNLNDEDGDAVPDADSIVYASSCTGITGFFSVGDPTPNTADIDAAFAANLSVNSSSSAGTVTGTLAGSSQLTQATGAIDEQGNWNYNFGLSGSSNGDDGTFKLNANETASYTYGGAALVSFGSLPPGTFAVNGNWTWAIQTSKVNVNLSFSVSTPTPLSINRSSCTSNPEGIQSGIVDIKFSDGTVVEAKWLSCPTVPSFTVS